MILSNRSHWIMREPLAGTKMSEAVVDDIVAVLPPLLQSR
jgi:hypothetical protein